MIHPRQCFHRPAQLLSPFSSLSFSSDVLSLLVSLASNPPSKDQDSQDGPAKQNQGQKLVEQEMEPCHIRLSLPSQVEFSSLSGDSEKAISIPGNLRECP